MPPHPKQTREDVLATAVQLVRSGGLASVNARDLAAALGISTRPLFTLFSGMDELKQQLVDKLNRYYNAYMDEHMRGDNRLVAQATSHIAFAREEPRIFDELFMNRTMQGSTLAGIAKADWNGETISAVRKICACSQEEADAIFLKVWLYAHGIATQIVANDIQIPEATVANLIQDAFERFARDPSVIDSVFA